MKTNKTEKPTHSTGHYYDYRDGENIALYDGDKIVGVLYGLNSAAVTRAHLWEAAPDMLAALKHILKTLPLDRGTDVKYLTVYEAIAKAEGRG